MVARRTVRLLLLAWLIAAPASAEWSTQWSISSSDTDPYANIGSCEDNEDPRIIQCYLWLVSTSEPASEVGATLSLGVTSTGGAILLENLGGRGGFLTLGDPLPLLRLAGTVRDLPVVAVAFRIIHLDSINTCETLFARVGLADTPGGGTVGRYADGSRIPLHCGVPGFVGHTIFDGESPPAGLSTETKCYDDSDPDEDGLWTDDEKLTYFTDPLDPDSDNDLLSDGEEVLTYRTDPNNDDTDSDGLTDGDEIRSHGTNPHSSDTDGDRLSDLDEIVTYGTDPTRPDTDSDGLNDRLEVTIYHTDPLLDDTDHGGCPDGKEVSNFRDPLDPADDELCDVISVETKSWGRIKADYR